MLLLARMKSVQSPCVLTIPMEIKVRTKNLKDSSSTDISVQTALQSFYYVKKLFILSIAYELGILVDEKLGTTSTIKDSGSTRLATDQMPYNGQHTYYV